MRNDFISKGGQVVCIHVICVRQFNLQGVITVICPFLKCNLLKQNLANCKLTSPIALHGVRTRDSNGIYKYNINNYTNTTPIESTLKYTNSFFIC